MNKRSKQERMELDLYDTSFRKIDEAINELSTKPGLYRIYNKRRKLIYVGISENIKKRVKNHLYRCSIRPGLIKQMYYIKVMNTDIVAAKKLEEEIIRLVNPFFNNLGPCYLKKDRYEKVYFPWDYPFVHSKHEFFAKRAYFREHREELERRVKIK